MRIGIAGLGFMGATHLGAYAKLTGIEVAAVSSGDKRKLSGDLSDVGGNLGRSTAVYDFSAVRKYEDWRALVADPEIDIVDVCMPTDAHAPATIAALEAGKHVLCEKPMALSIEDCERMMAAAAKHNRVLMVAQVLRFWPEYSYLAEFVKSGKYGRIRSATFVRRCGVPDWSRWLPDESRSGGAVVDLLVHDIDQALALFGLPDRVSAKGIGGPDTLMGTLIYPGGPEVRIQGGWFTADTPFSMGFQVRAERAELELTADGLMLSDISGQRTKVEAEGRDGYEAEIGYFVECCKSGKKPERCPPEQSALALEVALLLKKSRASGGDQIKCSV